MSYAVAERDHQENDQLEHSTRDQIGKAAEASRGDRPEQSEKVGRKDSQEALRETIAELQGIQDKMQIAARKLETLSGLDEFTTRNRYMVWVQGRMLAWLINGFSQPLHALRDILKEHDGS